jgi:hypothetical protein
MTVAELKERLPADTAIVYIDGEELLASDLEVDKDGDLMIYSPEGEEEDEETGEEEEDEEEDEETTP